MSLRDELFSLFSSLGLKAWSEMVTILRLESRPYRFYKIKKFILKLLLLLWLKQFFLSASLFIENEKSIFYDDQKLITRKIIMTSKKIRLSSAVFKSMAKHSWLFSSTCKTLQTRHNSTIIDNDWQSWSGKNLEYIKENYASIWKFLKTFGKTILIHDSLHFENLFKKNIKKNIKYIQEI